ncbi:hypothetical protein [Haladaptatus sp. DFWS20]|uniref:hypothetical protein n=1 Tax=Haladaptatus sp. DFWS20 TaxID=3403467 RepID=UPI003EB76DD0
MNFREKRAESQQNEDKYLDVLEHAKNVANTNDVMVARIGYREVATHYGCAYKNDGNRVMEEMAERIQDVSYKESRCAGRSVVYDGEDVTYVGILTNRFPEPS